MGHYAKIEDGIVTEIIVSDSKEWCETNLGGTWVETSNTTFGGVNANKNEEAIYKNYAGIGYTFDGIGFAAPQPFPSWTLNSNTYLWEAPVAPPSDWVKPNMDLKNNKMYDWNEEDLAWVEITVSE